MKTLLVVTTIVFLSIPRPVICAAPKKAAHPHRPHTVHGLVWSAAKGIGHGVWVAAHYL